MGKDISVFFVKPHALEKSDKIYGHVIQKLISNANQFELGYKGIIKPPLDFWEEFYSHLKPEIRKRVIESYAHKEEGKIDLSLIKGKGIVKIIKDIAGPTEYEENPDTIRGRFGPYELPDTLVHASDSEGVEKDIRVLRKYDLID